MPSPLTDVLIFQNTPLKWLCSLFWQYSVLCHTQVDMSGCSNLWNNPTCINSSFCMSFLCTSLSPSSHSRKHRSQPHLFFFTINTHTCTSIDTHTQSKSPRCIRPIQSTATPPTLGRSHLPLRLLFFLYVLISLESFLHTAARVFF